MTSATRVGVWRDRLPAVQEFLKRAQKAGLALLAFLLVALGLPLLDATAETPGLEVQLTADPQGAVRPGDSITYTYSIFNGTGSTLPGLSVEGVLPAGLTPTMTDTPIIIPAFGLEAADDFGSGGFDGSTGSQPWAGPWVEVSEVDGPGAGNVQVGVLDNDAVARLLGSGSQLTRTVDLTGFPVAYLTYRIKRVELPEGAVVAVAVSDPSTGTLVPVDQLAGSGSGLTDPDFETMAFEITELAGPATQIAFSVADGDFRHGGGLIIDSVSIHPTPPVPTFADLPSLVTGLTLLPGDIIAGTFTTTLDLAFTGEAVDTTLTVTGPNDVYAKATNTHPTPQADHPVTTTTTEAPEATATTPVISAGDWRAALPPDSPDQPLVFQPRVDPALDYIARGSGYAIALTSGQAVLSVGNGNSPHEVRMSFPGGNRSNPVGLELTTSTGDTPRYSSVGYPDIYPGIDLIYSADGRELEYSFYVEPGADPTAIALAFTGANELTIEDDGTLLIDRRAGKDLHASAPYTYQDVEGIQVPVGSSYELNEDGTIGFTIGTYERNLPLIIDPTLTYQEGTGGYAGSVDTWLDGTNPGTSHGTDVQIRVDENGSQDLQGLIRFNDLFGAGVGQIPYGSTINSASLVVNVFQTASSTTISFHQMLTAWSGASTFSSMGSGVQTDDAEAASGVVATFSDTTSTGSKTITGLAPTVQAWSDGAANHGWLILSNGNLWGFESSETGTVAQRPQLLIDYTPPASVITVNSTLDRIDNNIGDGSCDTGFLVGSDAECTLRAAIQEANASTTVDKIHFDIPTSAGGYEASPLAFRIQPSGTLLPAITDPVTIDGTTQSQYSSSARPVIVIDGANAPLSGDPNGLTLQAGDTTIRGLVIQNFGDDAIEVEIAGGNTIAGNYIGTDVTGTVSRPNGYGLSIKTNGNTIGGSTAAERNVLSGNTEWGIGIYNAASGNIISGNYIGADAVGTGALANGTVGVHLYGGATANVVGGTAAGAGNVIAFNTADGVLVEDATTLNNVIIGNSIFANGELGIDLGVTGVNTNDSGDGDSGANDLLNYPVITSATETGGVVTTDLDLDVPAGDYRIEFFTNPSGADPSTFGEGETLVHYYDVVSHSGGTASYSTTFAGSVDDVLTATSTEDLGASFGSTSEFAAAVRVTEPLAPPDLWISTDADVGSPSGVSAVDAWSAGALLGFGDPGLALGSGSTGGTLSLVSDFDAQDQSGDVALAGLHQVQSTITVGSSPSFTLQPGDLLFSVATNKTFVNADLSTTTIADKDVGLFRPAVLGDYRSGTFSVLLDQPLGARLPGLSLVETETVLSDITLAAGTFLLAGSKVVYQLTPTGTGDGVSSGTATVFLNGPEVGIDKNVTAIDLVEEWTVIDGTMVPAGTFLMSTDGEDLVGSNNLSTTRRDVFALTLTATTAGSGTGAGTAEPFFVGNDIGLDSNNEAVSGFAVVGGVLMTAPVASNDAIAVTIDIPAIIDVLDNDFDPNGDPLSVESFTQGNNGAVADNGDGTLMYTPDPGWTGIDTFTYLVSDGAENDSATVTVTVAPHSDPMALWRTSGSNTPKYSFWNAGAFGAANTSAAVGSWSTLAAAESPTRDEVIAVGVAATGSITAERWDGTSWSAAPVNPVGSTVSTVYRSFDVAYESLSGDALLVSAAGSGLQYVTWNGTSWTAPVSLSNYTALAGSNPPTQVTLASSPFGDDLVALVTDNLGHDIAFIWDGTSWAAGQTLGASSGGDNTSSYVTFERQSGRAVAVYSVGAAATLYYRIWNGSSWSAEAGITPPGGVTSRPAFVRISPDPGSNRIAAGVITTGVPGTSDIWLSVWDGSVWGSSILATSTGVDQLFPGVAVSFEGVSGQAMAAYGVTGQQAVRYRTWTSGSGWSTEVIGPNVASVPNVIALYSEPGTDGIMLATQDAANDLNYTYWSGSAWGSPIELETNSGETRTLPFTFLWRALAPPVMPPVAMDESASTPQDTPVVIDVLANDTDPNGDPLTVDSVTQGSNGTVVSNGTNVTYTPNAAWTGVDTFTYTVSDGNGGTDTATVTVIVLEAVVLDDIQKGTATIAGGSSAVTATITAVDPTKAFLTFTVRGNQSTPNDLLITGELTNATTLTFAREGTTGTVTIEWSVVEFVSGVSVQRGSTMLGSTTTNIPISAVDLSRSFVLTNSRVGGGTFGASDFPSAQLTSSTNLRISVIDSSSGNVAKWQVIQYNDASVQRETTSFASGDSSRTATVTAVDTSKAWLVYSNTTASGSSSNIGQKLIRGRVTNGTTLTFDRSSTGQTLNVAWELIEFTDTTTVQHASAAFSSSGTTQDVTIAAVDPTRSIAVGGTTLYGGRSAYTSDDNPGVGWFTTKLTNSTNLRVQRGAAPATADLGWFVVHWPGTAAPVVVNSTGDAGDAAPGDGTCWTGSNNSGGQPACTLRAAIQEANANSFIASISFDMPATESGHAGGIWTIAPGSALPSIATATLVLDATTQPGYASTPVVELNGTSAGAGGDGFRIQATDVTIRGFAINRFPGDGIEVDTTGSGAIIVGNHLGLDASGLVDRGNGGHGVDLQTGSSGSTVGGSSAADRNVISGNGLEGIIVDNSDGNTIIGNYVGTDVTGNTAISNANDGIHVANGSDNNIFGQPGAGNVIAASGNDALEIDDVSGGNIIQANIVGLGADGSTVLANGRHGVVLYNGANTTQIGGAGAGEGNVISGNTQSGVVIDGNDNAATTAITIAGNHIGTDATGALDRGNGTYGVHLFAGASGTTIGGTGAGAGNVISGNGSDGVYITGAASTGNLIQGNYIGVTAAGNGVLGNTGNGIEIDWEVPNQVIGGTAAGAGNVISANLNGIYSLWANDLIIQGNIIGLDATGTVDLGNVNQGIRVGGDNVVIGGTSASARNVVSGNGSDGILLDSATSATVLGNYVGTDATGMLDRGNDSNGVYVMGTGNVIGGSAAGAGNVISGNSNDGIQVAGSSPGTIIEGNVVGLATDRSTPVGNWRGISLYGTGARVGGTAAGTDNIIGSNSSVGIAVTNSASDVSILGNSLVGNGSIGIDLGYNGLTVNDSGDGDTGANDLLNFPVISAASETGGTVTVTFDLDVPAGNYRVEFFTNPSGADPSGHGEGETYVSSIVVTAGTGLTHTFTGSEGDVITATATHDLGGGSYGDTSEFSAAVTVVLGNNPPAFDQDLLDRTDTEASWISLSSAATDPDAGDTLIYSATDLPLGLSIDSDSGIISGVVNHAAAAASPYAVEVSVCDDGTPSLCDTDTFTWTITNVATTVPYVVAGTGGAGGGDDLLATVDETDFDPVTNEVDIGVGTGTSGIEAIAVHPTTGVVYGVDGGQFGTLNVDTGVFSPIGTGLGTMLNGAAGVVVLDDVRGLAFHPLNDRLFGVQRRAGVQDILFQIDVATGAYVPLAFTPVKDYRRVNTQGALTDVTDLAVDPLDWEMYSVMTNGATSALVTVKQQNGNTAVIGTLSQAIVGLSFDTSGQMWGTGAGALYQVDKTDGTLDGGRVLDNGSGYGGLEFGVVPALPPAVEGTVFEDVDGNALGLSEAVDDAENPGVGGVTVHMYQDLGTLGEPDAADLWFASTVTGPSGHYYFSEFPTGPYWIVVDSATVVPDAGGSGWAEQTFGPAGSVVDGSFTLAGGPGPVFGGMRPTVSDAPGLVGAEHVAYHSFVAGETVEGFDFGFSFNVVTNLEGGDGTSPQGSLRRFIGNANLGTGPNVMRFVPVVPTTGSDGVNKWWTVAVTAALPTIIDDATTIDGTTYDIDGVTLIDVNALGPEFEMSGPGAAPVMNGLVITSAGSVIQDVAIGGFGSSAGVLISGGSATGNMITSSYLGADATGAAANPNGLGVRIAGGASGNTVGGTTSLDTNTVSGNTGAGVLVDGAGTIGNIVAGNIVGMNATGAADLANGGAGITIDAAAAGTLVGGTVPGAANVIAYNTGDGVDLTTTAGSGNAVIGNIIFSNTGLGIDLESDGVTVNDADDVDAGPNDLLNFPTITSATETLGVITADFDLDVSAGNYRIEFYTNTAADGTGYGEGANLVHTYDIVGHPGGNVSYSTTFSGWASDIITLTATEETTAPYGSTSEFSAAYTCTPADSTPPVITLVGADPQTIEVGSPYTELGATALDNVDGDITGSIVVDASAVNTAVVGSYIVTYDVADAAGNDAVQVTRTVNVVDTTLPVIALVGANPQVLEANAAYVELGATASDNHYGDISGDIVIDASGVDMSTVGSYSVTYDVDDVNGNSAVQVTRTVSVVDTTVPVITLVGANPQTIEVGSPYSELGATASDDYDGDISGSISIDASAVNMSAVGSYSVTYDVDDSSGNSAVQVTRTVDVVDTTPPVIILLGDNPQAVEVNAAYVEAGATATDNLDGDISGSIVIDASAVDTSTLGSYVVTYDVTDANGNPASGFRTVNVVDTTVPVIALVGANPQTIEVGSPYTELGATAFDNYDGDITPSIVIDASAVKTATVGSYSVTYDVSDANSNGAVQVTRTVNVVDTTVPVITVLGVSPVTVEVGDAYVDAGATAFDVGDGDLTGSIVTVNPVNTAVVGSYTVTYDVDDAAGNSAVQVTRTVDVVDTTVPVITLVGADPVTVEVGSPYVDAGATATDVGDGDLTGSIVTVNPVDTAVVAGYTVTYDVADAAGNDAVQVTRTVDVVDTTGPVIALTGADPQTIEVGDGYVELGATASDNYDGDLSGSISIDASAVNTSVVGSYTVTYDVSDANGNDAVQVARTVNVVDTTVPVITMLGSSPVTFEVGDAYVDAGAIASDNYDGDITGSIVTVNPVNTAVVGSYLVVYNVSDANGNDAVQVTRTVDVVDTALPVITLLGSDPVTVEVGTGYVDAGATAFDGGDGDLTGSIVTVNPVDTAVVASYTVTYNVTDSEANAAVQVTRTVDVVDTTIPVITLNGANPQTIEVGDAYVELGATASDNYDGDISGNISIDATGVNTSVVGSYSVTYDVTDANSNAAAQATRAVNVVDTTIPVITLTGSDPQVIEVGDPYVELGATASDNYNGDISGSISIDATAVNTSLVGSYSVTYDVSDANGNDAVQVTRTVNVADTTAPMITLLGASPVTVEVGDAYVDAGATAFDVGDGLLTPSIVTVNPVNTSVVASYTVTYDVSDAAGNAAATVTRTVNVVDTTVPVITLAGANPQTIEVGSSYTELGATASDNYDGDISGSISIDATAVNTAAVGSYPVFYDVTDANGNPGSAIRTVDVVDTTIPVITLTGANPQTIEVGSGYVEMGATASDGFYGDISGSIVIDATAVNTAVVGTYSVTYDVTDANGNDALQVSRTVNVVDTTLPVIALSGVNPQVIEVGDAYTELGATASDNYDGDISGSMVIDATAVNTGVVGSYSVTYDVSDAAGNDAVQVSRTVNVVDTTVPVITLTGANPQTIEVGSPYTELGAAASDNYDGDISGNISIDATGVNTSVVGSYSVTYDVSDANGNDAVQVTRTVDVVDTGLPVITLVGLDPVTVEVGTAYVDAGATAWDANDGDLSGSIVTVNPVNSSVVGVYTVTYDVTDSNSNAAVQVTRTVNVVDTTIPVITLTGADPQTIEAGDPYVELGATAVDNYDGDISGSIVIDSSGVDTSTVGSYSVTYDVTDANGNPAVQIARTVNVIDTTIPVITLTGADPQTIEAGSPYTELGATASDNYDGDISGSIVIDSSGVDTSTVGSYSVTYDVSDANGNPAVQVSRTVNVVDTTIPVITLVGVDPQTIEVGDPYVELGATASDGVFGDISGSIVIDASGVDTSTVGSYSVTYDVTDANANDAVQVSRSVNVVDTTIPVIALIGADAQVIEVGDPYVELGATALDSFYGDISGSIVVDATAANTAVVGSYSVTYDVTDANGNDAVQVIRTVNVVDTTIPVIALTGADPQVIEVGDPYVELGATALDSFYGDISGSIVIDASGVDTSTVGSYSVTYDVTDANGNDAVQVTRTVDVVDTTVPVITLLGSDPVTVEVGTGYVDAGATAFDVGDGDLTGSIVIVNPVNTAVVGVYVVTYDVTDSQGNPASTVTRTVNVVDTTIPVIALTGANPQTIEVGTAYSELGATATDNFYGDITASVVIDATSVNISAVGSYSVTYDVTDANGNPAATVTRTVNVVDTSIPVITLTGANPQVVEVGDPYVELGATASDSFYGDITGSIVIDSAAVDTSAVGSFTVTYDVTDTNGNAAAQVNRTVDVVDTTIPVITLLGVSPVTVEVGTAYVDAGATAFDIGDGVVTGSISTANPVNTAAVGSYTVTYDVSDSQGNAAAQVTRTVDVVDTVGPVITLAGANPQTIEAGAAYVELGATASDVGDGDVSGSIVIDSSLVDTFSVGPYVVTYDVTDSFGNAAVQVTRTVTVVDTGLPVITLLGADPQVIEVGAAYPELGASAFDVADGDISGAIVIDASGVDPLTVGSYSVSYDVSDTSGNSAVQVVRTVDVADTVPPVITLVGANPQTIEVDTAYVELGATAADVHDGDVTPAIVVDSSAVDTSTVGSYVVLYDVVDSSGNPASAIRTVNVGDTVPPVITLLGPDPVTIEAGSGFTDPGATAVDMVDGDLTSSIVVDASGVNPSSVGSYSVTYDVSDSSGNASVTVVRGVNVVDTTPPTITLRGADPQTVEVGGSYSDPGATALDAADGDLTSSISIDVSGVDTTSIGTYSVFYSVSDRSGNAASATRSVLVADTTPPVITLLGANPLKLFAGDAYTEAGATAFDTADGDLTGSITIDVSALDMTAGGSYVVVYSVVDSSGNPATALRVVDVAVPNRPPLAVDDRYSVNEIGEIGVPAPGILGNDSDPDGDPFTVSLVTGTSFGDLVLNPNGSFTYIHNGIGGTDDVFVYQITDAKGASDRASVRITIPVLNQPPVAEDLISVIDEDGTARLRVTDGADPDGDPLTVAIVSAPEQGTAIAAGGAIVFTPPADWFGEVTIGYTLTDPFGSTAAGTVKVIVEAVNDAPLGGVDSIVLSNYLETYVNVLSNDSDVEGDRLSVVGFSQAANGTVEIIDGRIHYTPDTGFVGQDTFTYTVSDGNGGATTVEVLIEVLSSALIAAIGLADSVGVDLLEIDLEPLSLARLALDTPRAIRLLTEAIFQSVSAMQLPMILLLLGALWFLIGGTPWATGLMTKRRHWAVVWVGAEEKLNVRAKPAAGSPTAFKLLPNTRGLVSTGKAVKDADGTMWLPIECDAGQGWVNRRNVTEDIDGIEFTSDRRPNRLVNRLAHARRRRLGSALVGTRGMFVSLNGQAVNVATDRITEILTNDHDGEAPSLLDLFLESWKSKDHEVSVDAPLERSHLIPAECKNYHYLNVRSPGSPGWMIFFEYHQGRARIAGLGAEA